MDEQQAEQVEAQNKKDMLDPATTALIGSGAWFVIKAIAQSIAGWLGLALFQKLVSWYKARKARRKVESGSDISISENEPTEKAQKRMIIRRKSRR